MKLVSTVSLGLVLALGSATMMASAPAFAAKKEKKEKIVPAAQRFTSLSKEFRAAAGPVEAALKANDAVVIAEKLALLAPLAVSGDEKYVLSNFTINLGKLTKDPKTLYAGVVGMITSGSALPSELANLSSIAGQFASELNDNTAAKHYLSEAIRLGTPDVNTYLRLAETNFKSGAYIEGLSALDGGIKFEAAAGRKAPDAWFARGAGMALRSKQGPEIAKWSRARVAAYPSAEAWRDALVLYRDASKLEPQVQLDLFRLMRATKSLAGEADFYEYAALATERQLPGEAKSVIEEGYATGAASKASRPIAERLLEANQKIPRDKASIVVEDKEALTAVDGKRAATTGNAHLSYGEDAKALELFQLALKKGQVDVDTVNTRSGIAYLRLGQKAQARTAFTSVSGVRKDLAQFWLLWIDLNP